MADWAISLHYLISEQYEIITQGKTDCVSKNSAEKPVQLASTFSLFFSAALKVLLGFSQQLQIPRENSNVLNTSRA